jgi:hypothetical protein
MPDEEQLQQLPSGEVLLTPEIVSRLFPELVSWVTLLEEEILQKGQPLLSENRRDAEAIGIQQIDAVRVVVVDNLPLPSHSELRLLAVQTGLITPKTAGMTFGHGIVLKNGAYDRWVVAHELTHVRQYERLDGIEPFLKEYVKEISYPTAYGSGPLEMEASRTADSVLGRT